MHFRLLLFFVFASALLTGRLRAEELKWQPWSDGIFAQATQENRLVLLNVHAVWCHWCHVMDKETYADPKVQALLREKYLLVEVDADARPDIANRYEDYGWPATVVFDAKGQELVKRRGFLPPKLMASLLQAIIDDPTPGPSVTAEEPVTYATAGAFSPEVRQKLETAWRDGYDRQHGSWGTLQKYLEWDNTEYALTRALTGDREAEKFARTTLAKQGQLLDPAWGGVYQYSGEGDWAHPHFEKLIQFQAENIRLYALASLLWPDEGYLQTAGRIRAYVHGFLTSPEGAFYVSQNADLVNGTHSAAYFAKGDAARRKLGLPRVDQHLYARENGWMIRALVMLYRATGDEQVLADARKAEGWIEAHRAGPEGSFRHDEGEGSGGFLGDTLAMGFAALELYTVTGDRAELAKAERAATYLGRHFSTGEAGFATAEARPGAPFLPKPQYDENVALARFGNLLSHYTGKAEYHAMAERALRYLATSATYEKRGAFIGGALVAEAEFGAEPLHVTVAGPKAAPAAKGLFLASLRAPAAFKRTEWYDAAEGPLPGEAIDFPPSPEPVAFLCQGSTCSPPIREVEVLLKKLRPTAGK